MASLTRGPDALSQTLSPEELNANAVRMQREALRLERRENITTKEAKDRRADYVPLDLINRRVDQAGTEENLAARGSNRGKLIGWTTVFEDLQDDGTADPSFTVVNEGLGQTHRGKLQASASSLQYTPEPDNFPYGSKKGGRGAREIQGGNRGVDISGRASKANDRQAPIKRSRVVKVGTSSFSAGEALPARMKEPSEPSLSTNSLSQRTRSNEPTKVTKAPSSQAPNRPTVTMRESTARNPARTNIAYSGHLASPDAFMSSIQRKTATQLGPTKSDERATLGDERSNAAAPPDHFMAEAQPKQGVYTPMSSSMKQPNHEIRTPEDNIRANQCSKTDAQLGTSPASPALRSQADLMDLDAEPPSADKPVLEFRDTSNGVAQPGKESQVRVGQKKSKSSATSSLEGALAFVSNIEDLQASGFLTEEMLRTLQTVAGEVNARAKAEREKIEQAKAEAVDASRAEEAQVANSIKPTKASIYSAADIMALRPRTTSPPPEIAVAKSTAVAPKQQAMAIPQSSLLQEVAQQLTAQRDLIVGEHVHRTRFQRPQATGKSARPQLPPHLANVEPSPDMGAAARAQYGTTPVTSDGRKVLSPFNGQAKMAYRK